MTELIIDISYKCNSNCKYCQWNSKNSQKKKIDIPLNQVLLSRENLKSFDISRIVLSGGEPTLANHLKDIVTYYHRFLLPIRLITNGINLSLKKIKLLTKWGINEFVISIDAISYDSYSTMRANSEKIFQKTLQNIKNLANFHMYHPKIVSYIGLIVVLTSINCKWHIINQIISFAEKLKFNQVKFQPVFDDGYLSKNAPELKLTVKNSLKLEEIISNIKIKPFKLNFTNPLEFWMDLKKYLEGKNLSPQKCFLSNNVILLHKGILKFCFWCQHTRYGPINHSYSHKDVLEIQKKFQNNLEKCHVAPQCFCLQPINHIWS